MVAKEQLTVMAVGMIVIAVIAFIAGMYFAVMEKPCLQVLSECITPEKATALAKQTPHYQEYLQSFPNSTISYEGDYSSGRIVLAGDNEQPVLRINLISSGNIEYAGSQFECFYIEGVQDTEKVTTIIIYNDEEITKAIKIKGCN